MKREIRYLTTDLSLRALVDLSPLSEALAQQGVFTHHGGPRQDGSWFVQVGAGHGFPEPDQDIDAMLTAVDALDEPSQRLWSACTIREFNMGYDCGDEPWAFRQQLSSTTLARIAQVGASLVITIYPVIETDAVEAAVARLKKDEWIKRRTGKYSGHGTHHADSSALKKNQANVKVTLHGKKGSVYVHCLMELTPEGEWGINEVLTKEVHLPACTL